MSGRAAAARPVILLFALFKNGRWARRRTRGVEAWWGAIYAQQLHERKANMVI